MWTLPSKELCICFIQVSLALADERTEGARSLMDGLSSSHAAREKSKPVRSNVPSISLVDGAISHVRSYFTMIHAKPIGWLNNTSMPVVCIVIDYQNAQRMR